VIQESTGKQNAQPYRFGIVVSRFNEFITKRLLDGALECLKENKAEQIHIAHCPGAFEIPSVAQQLALTDSFDAIICLGCIIRGETPHFDYIAQAVASGISRVSLDCKLPVTFGVLTTENVDQAIARAGAKTDNKGWEAALAAIELADLYKSLSSKNPPR